MAGTVPRGVVRLEADAAMGLDSVVTLALGLGTGGTAEKRLRPGPGSQVCPLWVSCGLRWLGAGLGSHQAPQGSCRQQGSVPRPPGHLVGWPGSIGLRVGRKGQRRQEPWALLQIPPL